MNEGRLASDQGLDCDASQFQDQFVEEQVPYSHALQSTHVGHGVYLVGALARYNLNFARLSPTAQQRGSFGGTGYFRAQSIQKHHRPQHRGALCISMKRCGSSIRMSRRRFPALRSTRKRRPGTPALRRRAAYCIIAIVSTVGADRRGHHHPSDVAESEDDGAGSAPLFHAHHRRARR